MNGPKAVKFSLISSRDGLSTFWRRKGGAVWFNPGAHWGSELARKETEIWSAWAVWFEILYVWICVISICLSIDLSIHPSSIYLSVHLFTVYPYIDLSIHLSYLILFYLIWSDLTYLSMWCLPWFTKIYSQMARMQIDQACMVLI